MAFCTNCGGSVAGAFCPQCGTAVKPMEQAAAAPPAAPPVAGAAKRTSPLVWILGIFFGLFVLGILAMVAGGLFVAHKVKQAGLDPNLMARNPGIAITKMLAAANPDVSVVSVDEGKSVVTLLDKKTGKTVTVSFADIQEGKIKFQEQGQEAITVDAGGAAKTGALEIKGPDGTLRLGGGAGIKVPDWIPAYPSSKPQGTFSVQKAEEESGTYTFNTSDAVKDVMSFYDRMLQQGGFKITSRTTHDTGGSSGGMLTAEDADKKRSVVITLGTADGGTSVNVLFEVKK
jgi:hypothetical protein